VLGIGTKKGVYMLDAALEKYGETMSIDAAIKIAKRHGISSDEVTLEFNGDSVDTYTFINWMGY
jgi:hypothetical protein